MTDDASAPANGPAEGPDAEQALAEFLRAVRFEHPERARALLAQRPDVGVATIHAAAATGNVAVVRAFLARDPALATATAEGDPVPPLIYAVQDRLKRDLAVPVDAQVAVVRALLDAGASPNTTVTIPDMAEGIPALFFPCASGNVAVARVLLEHGAHPTDGESLYHAAQHDHRECLALLQSFGADLSRGPASPGNTPLHFLASHAVDNPIAPSAMRGLAWLLEQGADPNVPSAAAVSGDPSQEGERPLHRVVAAGHGEHIVALLLAHGAQVDVPRADGLTPYRLAVRSGNREAEEALAAAGADVAAATATDRLLGACMRGDLEQAQRIARESPGLVDTIGVAAREPLERAIQRNDRDALAGMLALGFPLTHESEWGGTPLHWAAWHGRPHLVRLLLDAGAPVNVRDSRYGSSPIAWAAHGSQHCDRGNDEEYPVIVAMLLDAGATRAESINRWQEPPERMARESVVRVLRERHFLDA